MIGYPAPGGGDATGGADATPPSYPRDARGDAGSRPTPEEAATVVAHFAHLERLADQGVRILTGRTRTAGEETFEICIVNAAMEDEGRALTAADPAVSGGVMRVDLVPYRVASVREQNATGRAVS